MSSDKQQLLIVISSLALGGPQKSLAALLQRLAPDDFETTLFVLNPSDNALRNRVPKHVRIVDAPPVVTAATLPKGRLVASLRKLIGILPRIQRARLLGHLLRGAVLRMPSQQIRQSVWRTVAPWLPPIPGEYSAAIGILGSSTYAVVDLASAKHKYHWVRSDSRMLNREESIEDLYFSSLDGALAVSQYCAEIFAAMYPRMHGRVLVYKNDLLPQEAGDVLPLEWQSAPQGTVKILTLARLDPLKGIDLALDATSLLKAEGIRVRWVVLGEGPERAKLEARRSQLGLVDQFMLPGPVIDVGPYLRGADLYVHPSRVEGRSNAVEEARAAGKPIIATRYSTVEDQVEDRIDGLICDIDSHMLAATIKEAVHEPALCRRLGDTAARRYLAERDDPNVIFSRLAAGDTRRPS